MTLKKQVNMFQYLKSITLNRYQSIHTSLQHKETGIFLEVTYRMYALYVFMLCGILIIAVLVIIQKIQIRSERMHRAAEATHNNYKALLLGDGQRRT